MKNILKKQLDQQFCLNNGAPSRSPGLAALFAACPGKDSTMRSTLKRVASVFNPFRVDIEWNLLPRVERQTTPLNPGLCDEAPLGLSQAETHAVAAEPFRIAPPEAGVCAYANQDLQCWDRSSPTTKANFFPSHLCQS